MRKEMLCGCYRDDDGPVTFCPEHTIEQSKVRPQLEALRRLMIVFGAENLPNIEDTINQEFDNVYAQQQKHIKPGQFEHEREAYQAARKRRCQCPCGCPGPSAYAITRDGQNLHVCTRCITDKEMETRLLLLQYNTDPLPFIKWDAAGALLIGNDLRREEKQMAKAN